MREHFPLAASALDIEDGIEDFPQVHCAGMTEAFGAWQQRPYHHPFGVAQIAGIGWAFGIGNFGQTTHCYNLTLIAGSLDLLRPKAPVL